jgi:hypothetical protein
MSKLACAFALIALATVTTAAAQSAVPDLRGTWKGESESIVLGGGNAHHTVISASEPELRSIAFTLTIDKQDGRRSGTFSSPRGGTIFLADAEGFSNGTVLAPDRIELCYLKHGPDARIASCVELTKQP